MRTTFGLSRHPEVRAKRASKDVGRGAWAVALRGPLRGHLRVTERGQKSFRESRRLA